MTRARDLSRLANANALTVDANNNVGVGSTIPTAKLNVVGDTRVGFDTSSGVILTSANGTKYRLLVSNAGAISTVVVP